MSYSPVVFRFNSWYFVLVLVLVPVSFINFTSLPLFFYFSGQAFLARLNKRGWDGWIRCEAWERKVTLLNFGVWNLKKRVNLENLNPDEKVRMWTGFLWLVRVILTGIFHSNSWILPRCHNDNILDFFRLISMRCTTNLHFVGVI